MFIDQIMFTCANSCSNLVFLFGNRSSVEKVHELLAEIIS